MAEAHPVRIAVVNDYDIVVAGMAALLQPYADRVEVVELDSRRPVISQVDVVLVDTFGRGEGEHLDLGDVVRSMSTKVVVFSWVTDDEAVRAALQQGVAGYLSKSLDGFGLVDALERVRDGERVLPHGSLVDDSAAVGEWPGQQHGLTPREAEVLGLITQGLSNQEIAERSYLSINSVKTYIRTAYRKIGVTRRAQAVAWGMRHGFMPDHSRVLLGRDRS